MATRLVSQNELGEPGTGISSYPAISADGRYIAYQTSSGDIVEGAARNIILHDTLTGDNRVVSVANDGTLANFTARYASISNDGNLVAFSTSADNLVEGDTNGEQDVFVHNVTTGITTRVSVDSNGGEADDRSYAPSISGDGKYITFGSKSDSLSVEDSNGQDDVFIHELATGKTTLVSVSSMGVQGDSGSYSDTDAVSADGRFVTFSSGSTNLTTVDTTVNSDVFVHDNQTGETFVVSVNDSGVQGRSGGYEPTISANGRFVAFTSNSNDLVATETYIGVDVFVYDTLKKTLDLVTVNSNGEPSSAGGLNASLSADGRYVTFASSGDNLSAEDTNGLRDIYVHDTKTGVTALVSKTDTGGLANGNSYAATISADGRTITYESDADNMVAGDTNEQEDVFVTDNPIFDFTSAYILGDDYGWLNGWKFGWTYGWTFGFNQSWHYDWYYGWNLGWVNGWYTAVTGWQFGWNIGWQLSWYQVPDFGWNESWYVGWSFGWSVGWFLGPWYYGSYEF